MKFLCDEMLAGLGKWLRAAGYDTRIVKRGEEDSAILELAILEERLLLTRDRQLGLKKGVLLLHANSLEGCIKELNENLAINWLYDPFSRCLLCNTSFEKHAEKWYCTTCDKLYWRASHTKRMEEQLHLWQATL